MRAATRERMISIMALVLVISGLIDVEEAFIDGVSHHRKKGLQDRRVYYAVCGGDVSLPRSIQKKRQKDEETRLT
jgi:hypothetical protein